MTPCIATVGTFDGLHLGHYFILRELQIRAEALGMPSRVITFFEHPLSVVAPDRAPGLLEDRAEIENRISDFGIDRVSMMHFTPELAALTAREFIHLIHERYGVAVLLLGYNNSMGSDRIKDPDTYRAIGREEGVDVVFCNPIGDTGVGVASSSRLRHDLGQGILETTSMLTGHHYSLSGTIAEGRHDGTRLGFPTLNLTVDPTRLLPLEGVYAGEVVFADSPAKSYKAVINVGSNPTLTSDGRVTVEAHVPGHRLGNCYGRRASFFFHRRMRPEMKFDSVDELRRAIGSDIKAMRAAGGAIEKNMKYSRLIFDSIYKTITNYTPETDHEK